MKMKDQTLQVQLNKYTFYTPSSKASQQTFSNESGVSKNKIIKEISLCGIITRNSIKGGVLNSMRINNSAYESKNPYFNKNSIGEKLKMKYSNEMNEIEKRVPASPTKSQPPTVNDKPTFNVYILLILDKLNRIKSKFSNLLENKKFTLSCKSIAVAKSKEGSENYMELPKPLNEMQHTYYDKIAVNTEVNKRISDKLINFLRIPLYEKFQIKQDEIRKKLIEDFESNKNQSQKLANKNPSLARFNTMNESSICKRK